jgi:hypothetical protein
VAGHDLIDYTVIPPYASGNKKPLSQFPAASVIVWINNIKVKKVVLQEMCT